MRTEDAGIEREEEIRLGSWKYIPRISRLIDPPSMQ